MDIIGNKILITDGTSEEGAILTKAFLSRKNEVIISSNDEEKLKKIQDENPEIEIVVADITKKEGRDKLFSYIKENHPNLTMLINNSSMQSSYDFLGQDDIDALIDEELDKNFISSVKITKTFLPLFENRDDCAILNITSTDKNDNIIYKASKSALHGFSVALREKLKDKNIKVFEVISPDKITDKFSDKIITALARDMFEIKDTKNSIKELTKKILPKL